MSSLPSPRIAFINGRFLPEAEVRVPFRQQGVGIGDRVVERTRTFRGRPFRIEALVGGVCESLAGIGLDPGMTRDELLNACEEVLDRNRETLDRHGDVWLTIRIAREAEAVAGEPAGTPTVIVDCAPLPLGYWSDLYRDGVRLVIPSTRRMAGTIVTPWARMMADQTLVIADMEARAVDPGAWSVLMDDGGHLRDGLGAHLFVVRAGEILTPRSTAVRVPIWRDAAIELARADRFPVLEADLRLSAVMGADEVFIAAAGPCLCRVVSVNGQTVGRTTAPVTRRLIDAYRLAVDCDFVAQATGATDG
jgi:branched-chain amino acid aminotransferase